MVREADRLTVAADEEGTRLIELCDVNRDNVAALLALSKGFELGAEALDDVEASEHIGDHPESGRDSVSRGELQQAGLEPTNLAIGQTVLAQNGGAGAGDGGSRLVVVASVSIVVAQRLLQLFARAEGVCIGH